VAGSLHVGKCSSETDFSVSYHLVRLISGCISVHLRTAIRGMTDVAPHCGIWLMLFCVYYCNRSCRSSTYQNGIMLNIAVTSQQHSLKTVAV
jgi:hypothetical protein